MLFNGGRGKNAARNRTQTTEFKSVDATVKEWRIRNNAVSKPIRVKQVDGAYCDLYPKKLGRAPVKLCVTQIGGHSWAGTSGPSLARRKNKPSQAIHAIDEMWEFFKAQ